MGQRKSGLKAKKSFNTKTFAGSNPINVIRARARELKLPQSTVNSCIGDINNWYMSNGPEWTVERLKFVKQCSINYMTSGQKPPKDSKVWFKRNQKGLLYGHWGTIMKLFCVNPKETAKFLQCYTVFARQGEPSAKQIKSYRKDIETPFTGDPQVLEIVDNYLRKSTLPILKQFVPEHMHRDVKTPVHFLIDGRFNNQTHKDMKFYDLMDFLSSDLGKHVFYKHKWVRECLGMKNMSIPINWYATLPKEWRNINFNIKPYPMAQIRWINEPGLKDRVVADFSKALEYLTFPLGKRLYNIVRDIPWDATYHESKAFKEIQYQLEHLEQGKKAYCFDLSKATERFPLKLQATVLDQLANQLGKNFKDMKDIFLKACELEAELPDGTRTKWSVGQPMGAYPSFALFSLTHGLLLMDYLYRNNIPYNHQFIVHGDDLVIFDEDLADYYRKILPPIGGVLNDFKSIVSPTWVEFNSKLISKDRIISMPKWRPINISNIQDQVSIWGARAIKFVFKSKRKTSCLKQALSIPYILPNGGSINPENLSIAQRLANLSVDTLQLAYDPRTSDKKFISYKALVLRNLEDDNFLTKNPCEGPIPLSDLHGRFYNSIKLSALQIADSLDRDLLQDILPTVQHVGDAEMLISFTNSDSNLVLREPLLDSFGRMLEEVISEFKLDEDLVKVGYIKQASPTNTYKQKQQVSVSKMNKLVQSIQASAI